MNKIAKHIIDEDNLQQSYKSIKLGVCKALSEFGLSPGDAENFLQKLAFTGVNVDPVDLLKTYTMYMIGGGAAAGLGTAWLRNKIEKTVDGTDTQDTSGLLFGTNSTSGAVTITHSYYPI